MFAKGLETCKPVEIFIKLLKYVYGQFIDYHVIIKAMYASVFSQLAQVPHFDLLKTSP